MLISAYESNIVGQLTVEIPPHEVVLRRYRKASSAMRQRRHRNVSATWAQLCGVSGKLHLQPLEKHLSVRLLHEEPSELSAQWVNPVAMRVGK